MQERQEEEDGNRRVDRGTRQMVPAGPHFVDLAIDHVRNPGQRMPVAGIAPAEGPLDPGQREPLINVEISTDVDFVVIIDEFMSRGLNEDQPDGHGQQRADRRVDGDRGPGGVLRSRRRAAGEGTLASGRLQRARRPGRRRGRAGRESSFPRLLSHSLLRLRHRNRDDLFREDLRAHGIFAGLVDDRPGVIVGQIDARRSYHLLSVAEGFALVTAAQKLA